MSNNILIFPSTETMSAEQALQSALQFAKQFGLQTCVIAGYDNDDYLFVRSSRMDRKFAL